MAYRNDRTERARLYRLWIVEQDRPCAICGSRDRRQVGHVIAYNILPVTDEDHCQVECFQCNQAKVKRSKFNFGDRVMINGRTPAYIELTRHTPRRVVSIRYDPFKECNFYTLGSNGRGETADGQPLEGIRFYEFRSYQLLPYRPRKYGKRKYTLKPGDPRLQARTSKISPAQSPGKS